MAKLFTIKIPPSFASLRPSAIFYFMLELADLWYNVVQFHLWNTVCKVSRYIKDFSPQQ